MRLTAEALTIGYGRVAVGKAIDLTLSPNRIVCLLGPNGCGKTTLFRSLLGLIPILDGAITLDDIPLEELPRSQIARRLAYVPQAHTPCFPFQAIEVVMTGRTARVGRFGLPGASDRAAATAAMARLGLSDLAYRDYSHLSNGQRQLVLMARALAQETPLIVMDEPTASLDFGNQLLVLGEIQRLARAAGQGILLSTHNPDHAFALEAEVILMGRGGLQGRGSPSEVLTEQALSSVYGVPIAVQRTNDGRRVCLPGPGRQ